MPPPPPRRRRRRRHRRRTAAATTAAAHALFRRSHSLTHSLTHSRTPPLVRPCRQQQQLEIKQQPQQKKKKTAEEKLNQKGKKYLKEWICVRTVYDAECAQGCECPLGGMLVRRFDRFGLAPPVTRALKNKERGVHLLCAILRAAGADPAHAREYRTQIRLAFLQLLDRAGTDSSMENALQDKSPGAVCDQLHQLLDGVGKQVTAPLCHSLAHSLARSLTHSLTHFLTRSLTCPLPLPAAGPAARDHGVQEGGGGPAQGSALCGVPFGRAVSQRRGAGSWWWLHHRRLTED